MWGGYDMVLTAFLLAPAVVVEAVALTAAIVVGLTLYTFWATRRGVDFGFMGEPGGGGGARVSRGSARRVQASSRAARVAGPMLAGCLWALILWSVIQLFWPPGPVGQTIFALLGAMLFSAYIVFDTQLIIARVSLLDDYVWASVMLYVDGEAYSSQAGAGVPRTHARTPPPSPPPHPMQFSTCSCTFCGCWGIRSAATERPCNRRASLGAASLTPRALSCVCGECLHTIKPTSARALGTAAAR